ncbi:hypothetical protein AAG747_11625 [Rapidithrix thailandica]|uniref:Lipoprotein n=1 Tax=Rapidithrix thailandica TaxID=413964 RepID=A0AAW9RUW6_9BACT
MKQLQNAVKWGVMTLLCSGVLACTSHREKEGEDNANAGKVQDAMIGNPPAEGFHLESSDQKAIEVADDVMKAMGGRQNWDNTRFISWNFFGVRSLVWDKWEGRVRIDIPEQETSIAMNIHTMKGKAWVNEKEVSDPEALSNLLQRGKEIWINDSYWLVMPFKLKDSGVTLKYQGEEADQQGKRCDVLQLTFESVGVTPENKYQVFVEKDSELVSQWAFFAKATDEEPAFVTPWVGYEKKGNILLSGDRGDRKLSEIEVHESLPDKVFTSMAAPTFTEDL